MVPVVNLRELDFYHTFLSLSPFILILFQKPIVIFTLTLMIQVYAKSMKEKYRDKVIWKQLEREYMQSTLMKKNVYYFSPKSFLKLFLDIKLKCWFHRPSDGDGLGKDRIAWKDIIHIADTDNIENELWRWMTIKFNCCLNLLLFL